jgi:hypothetical protein
MDNMEKMLNSHNKKILNEEPINNQEKTCSCRANDKPNCPLNGQCLSSNIVYRADVTTTDNSEQKTYFGICKTTFKARYGNHKQSFTHPEHSNDTELSKYIWSLKNRNKEYKISWSIAKKTNGYNPVTKTCSLCLSEKLIICNFRDKNRLLNKRSEMVSKCRHENKFILANL